MITIKSDKCKYKAWCWSCDERQSKPYLCFRCNEIITQRRDNYMDIHFNNPNQYLL